MRTLIQGATLLYIDRWRGLRLSLEVPIGPTLDTVERFPIASTATPRVAPKELRG